MRTLFLLLALPILTACGEPYVAPSEHDLTRELDVPDTPLGGAVGAIWRTGYPATDASDCAAFVGTPTRAHLLMMSGEWKPAFAPATIPWAVVPGECVVILAHHADPDGDHAKWCTGGEPVWVDGATSAPPILPTMSCGFYLEPGL